MKEEVYKQQWKKYLKPNLNSADRLTMAAMGLSGEVGEVIELLKKARFHSKPYEKLTMIKELGDLYFYLTLLCEEEGISLDDVRKENIKKLEDRHPHGFKEGY